MLNKIDTFTTKDCRIHNPCKSAGCRNAVFPLLSLTLFPLSAPICFYFAKTRMEEITMAWQFPCRDDTKEKLLMVLILQIKIHTDPWSHLLYLCIFSLNDVSISTKRSIFDSSFYRCQLRFWSSGNVKNPSILHENFPKLSSEVNYKRE